MRAGLYTASRTAISYTVRHLQVGRRVQSVDEICFYGSKQVNKQPEIKKTTS